MPEANGGGWLSDLLGDVEREAKRLAGQVQVDVHLGKGGSSANLRVGQRTNWLLIGGAVLAGIILLKK